MKIKINIRKSCLLLILLTSTVSFSQERIINLGDFNILKVFNGLSLELVRSDEQKIVISGEKKKNVTVKITNGKLKIFLKNILFTAISSYFWNPSYHGGVE